jgi:hypothetical protein
MLRENPKQVLRENPKQISRQEMIHRCHALPRNLKRNKRFMIIFLILVPTLTILFAGGLTPFVLITWLGGLLFAGWIAGALGGDASESDCRHFLPCTYECPLGYPEWCPHQNRHERGKKSPYEIID